MIVIAVFRFTYLSDGQPIKNSETFWRDNEPNGDGSGVVTDWYEGGRWNDIPEIVIHHVVCEIV